MSLISHFSVYSSNMGTELIVSVFLLTILSNAFGQQEQEDEIDERSSTTGTATLLLFIYGTVLAGVVIKYIIELVQAPFPFQLFLLVIGALIGFLGNKLEVFTQEFMAAVPGKNEYLLMIALPLLIFKQCLCMEVRSFIRCITPVFIISIPCTIINGFIVGFIMRLVENSVEWPPDLGIMYGFTCVAIYPQETLKYIRDLGMKGKHLSDILDGEVIFGTVVCIVMIVSAVNHADGQLQSPQEYSVFIFHYIIGGFALGCIAGYFITLLMRLFYDDAINIMIVSVSAPFMIYYIGIYIFEVCGVLSLTVVGIWMSFQRPELVPEIETSLVYFWELLSLIMNSVVFAFAGILFGMEVLHQADISDVVKTVIAYMVVYFSRVGTFIIFSLMISRLEYGISMRHMITAAWGGARGAITLCLVMISYHYENRVNSFRYAIFGHVTGIVFLSLLINVPTVPCLLNCLGLSSWSLARQNNMNSCVRHIMTKRDRVIALLKMDRFLADANWSVVNSSTVMRNPYKSIRNGDTNYSGETVRDSFCPDCHKEVSSQPTQKEIEEMRREARMRVLKAKKISYTKQYENGMLSKEAFATLTLAVEIAQNNEDNYLKIEHFLKHFNKKIFVQRVKTRLLKLFNSKVSSRNIVKPLRKHRRRILHKIVSHPAYFIFNYIVIVCNIVECFFELNLSNYEQQYVYMNVAKGLNWIFFLYFFGDILLKVLGHTWTNEEIIHMRDPWMIFDVILLMDMIADIIIDILDIYKVFLKYESLGNKSTIFIKILRIVRLFRLITFGRIIHSLVIRFCDMRIDAKMSSVYDIGKGFVKGEEEVLNMLDQMIPNKEIRQEMRQRMESDKLAVTKELGLIQKEKPWIAITVKTKQAIRTILNNMEIALEDLRASGWIDHMEYKKLIESVNEKKKYARRMKIINSSPPKVIFQEVIWMGDETQIIDFLFKGVHTKIYEPGEAICVEGEKPPGIFIIITGLFKSTYIPNEPALEDLRSNGILPVVDYITSDKFHRTIEEYIVSGNCIGELSFLTGRPYNACVVADTPSQVYILPSDLLEKASQMSPDVARGFEARMWKYISLKLAVSILLTTPAYISSNQEKLRYALERCFVPNLRNIKVFMNNVMIEDIVLIEGVVTDCNTKDIYIAPCYIPRTVQKLSLAQSGSDTMINLRTKLLIIPTKDVEPEDIMEAEEEIAEFYQNVDINTEYYRDKISRAYKRKRRGKASYTTNTSRKLNISDTMSYSRTTVFSFKSRNNLMDLDVSDYKKKYFAPDVSHDTTSFLSTIPKHHLSAPHSRLLDDEVDLETEKVSTIDYKQGTESTQSVMVNIHPFSVIDDKFLGLQNIEKKQDPKSE
ncbi:hypothetical protein WA026_018061 [Henosepilachna vigintioctopunctata]|uniref:Cyclic nucleotide-binding domain-containing protein n=1 Tax=Henosepilachna vigintioctopunctata TaxID=420089 RepID=A0AAW1UDX9_9CUCU